MKRAKARSGLAGDRSYNDPRYKEWRRAVLSRDNFRCVMCDASGRLKCHHIRKWSDYPTLRYNVANGATLCQKCHVRVTGSEDAYAPLLMRKIHARNADK
jgi:5-methylcytosine-specific restriction endonuclease McrA